MNHLKLESKKDDTSGLGKILLAAPPFWSPLIPSQGPAVLKGFLRKYGYNVKTADLAVDNEFLEFYRKYFDTLREFIPPQRRGNFYNIGHDVLRNHMMAYTNYKDENSYFELVEELVYQTYFLRIEQSHVLKLNRVVESLFARLKDYFLNLLKEVKPSVLGLTVNSGNFPAAHFLFKLTREFYPSIMTVMGGCIFFNHLAAGNPDLDYFLEKTKAYIDKLIIGKGEILFLKLLRGELPESQRVFTQADVNEEEVKKYIPELPDLTDYNLDQYFYLAASGSSSCPFHCSFCNTRTFFGEYRKKDAVKTVQEMIRLHEKYGHRLFFMTDALLNPVITGITKELIKSDVSLYMDGYFIVDKQTADPENTFLWRQGGFYRARLGVESGSQKILDLIGKPTTPEMIKNAVSSLASAGIKTTTYWVIGHPGETEEDFRQTLALLEELKNDIWQAECNPFTYFYVGQVEAGEWAKKRELLYPAETRDMLISQTWVLNLEPFRKEIYDRVIRFVTRCDQLGIPNPYSLNEIYKADERWKKLHRNAVPSIIELMNNEADPSERKKVEKLVTVQPRKKEEEGDFAF
jgi:radical SAM superfamily enzyme YgiQ (UPF0313 family)